MTDKIEAAIDALEMLSLESIRNADEGDLRRLNSLCHHWRELTDRALNEHGAYRSLRGSA